MIPVLPDMSPTPHAAASDVPAPDVLAPDGPASLSVHDFPDRDRLMDTLAAAIAARLAGAVAARGGAVFVASGGTTPAPLYDRLCRAPIDWSRVRVTLSDERWVPDTDPDSNAGLLARRLLTDRAAAADLVPLYTGDATAAAAVARVDARLQALSRPVDVVLLGMGDDAHTASLFPDAAGLAAALDPAGRSLAAAITVPATGAERMTLTLPALAAARQVFVLIAGAAKRRVLATALEAGPVAAMPVRAVLRQTRAPVAVYWAP